MPYIKIHTSKILKINYFFNNVLPKMAWASQMVLVVKNLPVDSGDIKRLGFHTWVRKIP